MQIFLRSLTCLVCFLVYVCANAATRIESNSLFAAEPSADSTILELRCYLGETHYYQSKLALIKTADHRFDYGLSTGHGVQIDGLDFSNDCIAQDYKGQNYRINALYVPQDIAPGGERDWALIRLEKVKASEIVRFSLPSFHLASADAFRNTIQKVTFAKARGIGFNTQICQSLPADHAGMDEGNILAHNCRAISGQSGSPISVSLDNQPILVGIHLGTGFVMHSKYTGKSESLGYFRFIDSNMVSEINDVITRHFN